VSAAEQIRAAREAGDVSPPVQPTFAERYPLHQKMADRKDEHDAVSDFLTWWYDEQNGYLRKHAQSEVDYDKLGEIIGEYFGAPASEFEREKRRMLEEIRETGGLAP
jgi:hypothetical protein